MPVILSILSIPYDLFILSVLFKRQESPCPQTHSRHLQILTPAQSETSVVKQLVVLPVLAYMALLKSLTKTTGRPGRL